MSTTRVRQRVRASRDAVYRAILDPAAVQRWMVPDGMTSEVHAFEAREGGAFRISLTYDEPTNTGKTTARTDTHHGRFVKLVPHEQIVQVVEFESDDPALATEMTITYSLFDEGDETIVEGLHEGLPDAVSAEDNETGWRMSLAKLAALVEGRRA